MKQGKAILQSSPRTRDYLVYAAGEPAIALLDIDLKGVPDGAKSLINEAGGIWSALRAVLPTLATVARVTRPSTSAGLRNRKTGEIYPDSGGFHAVIAVADGGDRRRAEATASNHHLSLIRSAYPGDPDRFGARRPAADRGGAQGQGQGGLRVVDGLGGPKPPAGLCRIVVESRV
jgi:hypothetical protein